MYHVNVVAQILSHNVVGKLLVAQFVVVALLGEFQLEGNLLRIVEVLLQVQHHVPVDRLLIHHLDLDVTLLVDGLPNDLLVVLAALVAHPGKDFGKLWLYLVMEEVLVESKASHLLQHGNIDKPALTVT